MKSKIVALALFSALVLQSTAADVSRYLVVKGQDYRQTNSATVLSFTNESPFRFVTSVDATTATSVTNVTVKTPSSSTLTLDNIDGNFDYEAGTTTSNALDANFKTGLYSFTIQTRNDGTNKPSLTLTAGNYPSIPKVDNFTDLQAVEPEQPLAIYWGSFTNGTTNDFIVVDISQTNGEVVASTPFVLETNALNGTNLVALLPANLLDYNTNYVGRVLFVKRTALGTNVTGALGIAGYYRQTKFPLITLPAPPNHGRVQFAASAYSVAEDGNNVTVTITRSGTDGHTSVDVFTSDGSARDGFDYEGLPTTQIDFHDGESNATVTLDILDNYLLASNKTFNVSLANITGTAELGLRSNTVVTILDNEIASAGKIQFSATNYIAAESNKSVAILVNRVGGSNGLVSATFVTANGTALSGVDYGSTNAVLVFSNGVTSRTITVPIVNDSLVKTNELFYVRLLATTGGAALGTNFNSTVRITDNDLGGTFAFKSASYTTNENSGSFAVTVVRTGGLASDVSVDFATQDGTALAGLDYYATNGTLSFGSNELSKTFLVGINNDTNAEGAESFTVQLSNATGGAKIGATNAMTTLIIKDDESSVNFTNAAYVVSEGATNLVINVIRTGALITPVSVDYSTANISAVAGMDYTNVSGTLSFPTNTSVKSIVIPIKNDTIVEGAETFSVTLANPQGGVLLGTNTFTTVTINDNDAGGLISLSATNYLVAETGTNAVITLLRTGGLASGVTVDFTVSNVTATAGFDYTNVTQTVTFNAGETNKKVLIPIINDTLVESNETVFIKLVNFNGGANPGSFTVATLTITNDDVGGVINFSKAAISANENATNFLVNVIRTGGKASAVTVDYYTVSGTATANVDYTSVTNTLTFGANETNKVIFVPIINDTNAEGSETLNLILTNVGGGATLGATNNATLTIVDDESSIAISSATYTVSEAGTNVAIRLVRGGALLTPVSVDFTTANISADDGSDYRATNGTVNFPINTTNQTILVPIINDTIVEGAETFNFRIFNPQGGVQLGTITNTVVTITDNDVGGIINLSASSYSVAETGTNAVITLLRTNGAASGVSVLLTVADGTATAGLDYTNVTQTVTFIAGETNKKVNLPIINDTLAEGAETIAISLSNAGGGANLGGVTSATLTITDNDLGGVISFASATNSAYENGTNFLVSVRRTGGAASGVTVNYFTQSGVATSNVDYTNTVGTLTFAANETNKFILVPIINDLVNEGNETFSLSLTNVAGGATLGAITNATLTILDDESSISIGSASYTVSEAVTNLSITLTRSGPPLTPVSVDYSTTNISATNGVHFALANGTATFAANVSSQVITIPITNDFVVNSDRSFRFAIKNPQGGVSLGSTTNVLVTITNDDFAGVIQFGAATFSGTEGSNAVITLTRTGGTAAGIFIYVSEAGITATAGLDFTSTAGYVAFGAGETNKTLLVPIIADALTEPTETVSLFFGPIIGGASIGAQNVATLSLLDKPDPNAIPLVGGPYIKLAITGINGFAFSKSVNVTNFGSTIISGTSLTTTYFTNISSAPSNILMSARNDFSQTVISPYSSHIILNQFQLIGFQVPGVGPRTLNQGLSGSVQYVYSDTTTTLTGSTDNGNYTFFWESGTVTIDGVTYDGSGKVTTISGRVNVVEKDSSSSSSTNKVTIVGSFRFHP